MAAAQNPDSDAMGSSFDPVPVFNTIWSLPLQ
jgi:hypothetical protein